MNKTLLAVAIALAYSVTSAWAAEPQQQRGGGESDPSLQLAVDDHSTNSDNRHDNGERNAKNLGGYGNAAANNGSTANANFSNSFNESKAIAKVDLTGTVTGNTVYGIGNVVGNSGTADGAA
ncbi:MAG: hypothetical protein WCA83_14500, partial [Azonexus sp.]